MDVVAIQMMVAQAVNSLRVLRDDEAGQGLVEYALIIFVVSVGVILALGGLTGALNGLFGEIAGDL